MAAHQAPPSLGFSRQEYWSGVPLPSPYQRWTECKSNFFPKEWICLTTGPMTLLFFSKEVRFFPLLFILSNFFTYFFFNLLFYFTQPNPNIYQRCYCVSDVHICTHIHICSWVGTFLSQLFIHSFIFMKEKKKNLSNPKVLSCEDRNLKKNSQIEISLQCCKHSNVFTCLRKKMVPKINEQSLPSSQHRGELKDNMDFRV